LRVPVGTLVALGNAPSAAAAAPRRRAPPPRMAYSPDAPFCPACGSLVVHPDFGDVACDRCAWRAPMASLRKPKVVTTAAPSPPPAWVVEDEAAAAAAAAAAGKGGAAGAGGAAAGGGGGGGGGGGPRRAVVREECPACGAPEMGFYTMQLRSADEGQTVFFECLKSECGHKFSVNT